MNRFQRIALAVIFALCALVCAPGLFAQVAGQNVNMVSGTTWPTGDPFLQRQNEPSMAVSTRNPMHILAGANDYRTVDLEMVLSGGAETGDSWLGLFKSFDGGLTWQSTLLPGCKYLVSQCQDSGALTGRYDAGSDPVVRAGTNGMFYYAGLAFDRATSSTSASSVSAIFVARYDDLNNNENTDPITYIDTHVVASGNSTQFLDKPALAVDIPRSGAATCSFTANEPKVGANGGSLSVHQSFAAGNVYLAYTDFLQATKSNSTPTHLMVTHSTDCGVTWGTPVQVNTGTTTSQGSAIAINPVNGNVYVVWRQFASTGISNAIMVAQSTNAGKTFSAPVQISTFTPFDQGTTGTAIRTNAYPSITTDNFGFVYVSFSAKGLSASGDARVVATGSIDGTHWLSPIMVDNPSTNAQTDPSGRGHQIMPAITFANGRLTILYYDLRLDHYQNNYTSSPSSPTGYTSVLTPEGELAPPASPSKVFTPYLDDAGLTLRRHTIDLRVLELGIFPTVTLGPSVLVSQYAYGCCVNPNLPDIEQYKFNVPNLPLFDSGQEPFLGDYIDVVPSPAFLPSGSSWVYNFTPSVNPQFHATWTDNRDVVPPSNGNWEDYTPAVPVNTKSVFDPGATLPNCQVGQEGMRNQNIYTAQITGGLVAGAPGNFKPLGTTVFNGKTVPFQRAFAVEAQNTTSAPLNIRFSIANQPTGGAASFEQFTHLTTLDVTIPAFSSVSRSVFVTSTNADATVTVNVVQITSIGGSQTTNGLSSATVLNPDVTNPNITNPNVTNPNITNPNITNFEVTNPNVTNPNITNPNVTNPNITNPNITNPNVTNPNITNPNVTNVSATNPNITNPNITNPDVTNPNITNPNITNPNVTNGSIQDVIYPVTNNGNTIATYDVKVAESATPPNGVLLQLILNKLYQTPTAIQCQLTTETHWVTVANIINPKLYAPTDPLLGNPNITNSAPNEATVTLAPGETAYIDFRVFSPTKTPINPLLYFVPVTIPHAVNTTTALTNPGTTTLPPVTVPPLIITNAALPDDVSTQAYSATVGVQGGNPSPSHTFSVSSGALPGGLTLNPTTGTITGTPTATGTYTFSIQVKDAAIGTQFPQHTTTQAFTIHVVAPLVLAGGALPGATQGTAYSNTIVPTGGLAPVTLTLASGSVPAGLNFTNGAIAGTPTGTGLSNFTVKATDSSNPPQVVTQPYSINVVAAGPNIGNISFVAQPANSTGGQVISGSPVTVQVFDNTHAVVPNVMVTMALNGTSPCSAAVLSGTLTQSTGPTGIASFPDLSIDRGQIGYTLQAFVASAPTVKGISNAFTVNGFCPTGSLSVARDLLTSTLLQNGNVLVAGGQNSASAPTNNADLYNPATGAFTATTGLLSPRYSHTATLLNDGTVLIVGGRNTAGWVATAEIFNPANGTFTNTTHNPVSPRSQHTATLLADGTVLLAGGFYNSSTLNTAEIYNPATQTFTSVGPMHEARINHTATLLANGKVLIATGQDAGAEIYDPVAQTFTVTGSLNTSRQNPSATLLSNGKVLIAGGLISSTTGINTAELYDPVAGTFSYTGNLNHARGYHTATLLTDGTVMVAGGFDVSVSPDILITAEIYNPVAGTFSNTGSMSQNRWESTATILNDGTALTAGGFGGNSPQSSAERFYSTSTLAALTLTTPTVTLVENKLNYQFLQEQGGVGPLTWSLQSGPSSLPAGTAFNSTNGLISGTPTVTGSFPLTVTITDSSSPAKSAVTHPSVNVLAPLAITTTTLPNGTVGVPYSAPINTSGGTPPISFSFTTASFPPGLTITQPPTGTTSDTLAGTPTTQGTYNFSESVADSGSPTQMSTQAYSVTINAAAPPPAVMSFTTQPGNEITNQNIPQFVVNLKQGGAPVVNTSVSLGFGNAACSSASLSGTATVQTDNNGNATFSQAFIDRGSPGYTLTATSTAPAATATSNAFNVPGFCATTPLTTPLDGQVGVLFPNGQVLMVGGYNTISGSYVLPGEIYTPGSGFANTTGSLHTGRTSHTATLLTTGPNAGSVLIVGGIIDNNNDGTATTELFNPSTGMFTPGPSMSVARYYHTATLLSNGDVLIAGGASSAQANAYLNTAEIYRASTGQFSPAINMTAVHAQPTATLLPNGQVLIAGGFVWISFGQGFTSVPTAVAELFDPSSNSFSATGSLETARAEDIAVLLPNGTVLVAGGTNSSNTVEGSAEIYSPASGAFTYTSSMAPPTLDASAALLPSGKVLISGGFNSLPESSQAQLYDPGAQTFTAIQPMVTGRQFFPFSVLNNGTVLVPGGYGSGGSIALSELYYPDPSSGIQVTTPSPLPTALTNSPYTQYLEEQGGIGPLSWSSPNLPEGMSLSQSGLLSGSPVPPAGSTNLTVQVSDSSNPPQSTSAVLVFNVDAPIQITTATLPDAPTQNGAPPGTSNVGYSQQVLTTGGAGGATTFSVISGALPSSMTLDPSSGVISATNVTDGPQTFNFTIQAVSAGPPSSSTSQALSIRIVPLFYGTTSNTLPNGTVGTSYSTPITSGGGISPDTYSFAYGSLPPGLNVISTGAVTGTPTAAGSYNFTITASDSSNPPQVYYEQFSITIAPPAQTIAHLSFSSPPAQTIDDSPVNGTSSPSVQVLATDASSTPVPNATLTIGYGTKPCSSAMLEVSPPPTAVTDSTGTATFSSLRTYTSGDNGYTLTVTSSNNISATSNTFNVTGYCTAATPIAAHSGGATVALANGMVLITGGQDSTSGAPIVKTAELYNPANGTFTQTGSMNVARSNHRATLLSNGMVLITGGISATSPSTVYESSAEIYDPSSGTNGTFTLVAPPMSTMGVARAAHTATLLSNGNVLIAGGQNSSGNLNETELYSPGNGFLVNDGQLTSPRSNATATLVTVGSAPMVLIAGGYGTTNTAPGLNTAELYDPSVGSFTATTGMMTAGHVGHTATLLNNGTVLIAGGEASGGSGSAVAEIFTASPSSQTFAATTGGLNVGRSYHSAALLSNGKVLFSGGWTNYGNASTNQAEVYDPTASTFSRQGLLAYSRSLAGIVVLSSGQVLVVGGIESGSIGSVPAEVYNPGP